MSFGAAHSQGDGPVPSRAEFVELAREADLIPVYREIPFDNETAVTAYSKLSGPPFGFLLEPVRRGPYAGAVGHLSFDRKNLDTAIAIRTILVESGRAHVQAGAGIVADSVPSCEYEETLGKAQALLKALQVSRP